MYGRDVARNVCTQRLYDENENNINSYNIYTMRKIILICLLALMGTMGVAAQATLTHTNDADFKKGYLNNMKVENGSIVMPAQAASMGAWAGTIDLPTFRKDLKVREWNGFAFLTGGRNTGAFNTVYRTTINANGTISAWTSLNSLPVTVYNHEMVIANGYIFVLGGVQDGSISSTIYYAKIISDNTIGNWQTSVTSLPVAMQGFTAGFINGHIIIAGGTTQSSGGALSSVYSTNVGPMGELSTYTLQANSLPEARNEHSMVSSGSYLYVLGGHDTSYVAKSTVYYSQVAVDGTCSAWLSGTNLPMPASSHSSTCQNGLITVLGGYFDLSNLTLPESTKLSYFAQVDNSGMLSWDSTAYNIPYAYSYNWSNGDAIAIDERIISFGGKDIFGNIKNEVYYNSLTPSIYKVQTGGFVSHIFDLFGNRQLINLSHLGSGLSNYSIYYRTAEQGTNWSTWVNAGTTDTIPLSLTKRHVQYMFSVENASASNTIALESVSLAYNTTQVSGILNGPLHWTLANSPYVVVGDITLASDTLIIDPGVEVLFYANTGFEIGQASLLCNGTQTDSIKFAYFGEESGQWKGLYFNANSDNGVTSSMQYTIIEKAGAGTTWHSNLYCYYTNQPTISHCTFRDALGYGVRLVYSPISMDGIKVTGNSMNGIIASNSDFGLSGSEIKNNTFGVHLTASSATISGCQIINNSDDGIYSTSSSPTISQTTIQNNGSEGIYFTSSTSPTMDSCQIINNASHGIYCTSSHPSISYTNVQGNGDQGVYFNSSNPQLMACTIQNNASHGIYATSSNFSILNCTIQNNDTSGVYMNGGTPELSNSEISGNSGYGVQVHNSSPDFINVDILNNANHGFYMSGLNSSPQYYNFTMSGNLSDAFRISGGDINTNSVWQNGGYEYIVEGVVYIRGYQGHPNLTIEKGNTIRFFESAFLYVGYDYDSSRGYGGELDAKGTEDSLIYFTSMDSTSIWHGNYFNQWSDNYSSTSELKYCIFENTNSYGLHCSSTSQPNIVDHCIFRNSNNYGFYSASSSIISNCQFSNNTSYGLYANASTVSSCTVTNNLGDGLQGTSMVIDNCTINNNGSIGISGDGFISDCNITSNGTGVFITGNSTLENILIEGNSTYGIKAQNSELNIINVDVLNNGDHGFYMSGNTSPEYFNFNLDSNLTNNIHVWTSDISSNRTWHNGGYEYVVEGVVYIRGYQGHPNLTIEKGNTIRFFESAFLYVGYDYDSSRGYGGELDAKGTEDSLIYFTSMDSTSIWHGNYFNQWSDNYSSTSELKYCIFENTNSYGLHCSSTSQPNIVDHCIFRNSNNYGFYSASSSIISNCQFSNNTSYGLYAKASTVSNCTFTSNLGDGLQGTGMEVDSCSINNNGGVGISGDGIISDCNITSNGTGVFITGNSTLENILIEGNSTYGIKAQNSELIIINVDVLNNGDHGFYMSGNTSPEYYNLNLDSNLTNNIHVWPSDISSNRTWHFGEYEYIVEGVVYIRLYQSKSKLTIEAGNTIRFFEPAFFHVGYDYDPSRGYGGELDAKGTEDSLIYFTSMDSTSIWHGNYFNQWSDNYGSSSELSHCVFENANSYGLHCSSTNQPSIISDCTFKNSVSDGIYLYNNSGQTIENCSFIDNGRYGVYLNSSSPSEISNCLISDNSDDGMYLSNSSPHIYNSNIINNQDNGIYLTGSSNPTIGNTDSLGCDIFYNENYNIYNNTTNDINARYNNWNSSDSSFIAEGIYDYFDLPAKGIVFYYPLSTSGIDTFKVTGNAYYAYADSVLPNVELSLSGTQSLVQFADTASYYSIDGLTNGSYQLSASTTTPFGGVNATDALKVLQHSVGMQPLDGIFLEASDVNGSGYTNSTDALWIKRRTIWQVDSFPAGDWILQPDYAEFSTQGQDITNNVLGICYGDVNGSYDPTPGNQTKSLEVGVDIAKGGFYEAESLDVFEVPVFTNLSYDVAAVTLFIDYPANLIQIENVLFNEGEVVYTAVGGHLRLCWCSTTPIYASQVNELMRLKVRALGEMDMSNLAQYFTILPGCEIADSWAEPLEDVVLLIPELVTTGIGDTYTNVDFRLGQNYPNPFNKNTIIEFVLPEAGHVKLAVYNVLGENVAELIDGSRNAGLHKIEFNNSDLAQGNYIYKLVFESGLDFYQESKMMNIE